MSRETVSEIVAKTRSDDAFREGLLTDPTGTLAPYDARLSDEEKQALSSAASDPFALASLVESRREAWWRSLVPTSFKEFGGSVLSVVLVLAFLLSLVLLLTRIGSDPRGVTVGGREETVDEFSRAKDVLSIVIPLFGAVVTFWLGVAVEARRADEHRENATQAGKERDEAKESERKKTTTAATALAEVRQAIRHLRTPSGEVGVRGLPGEQPEMTGQLDELEDTLAQAQRRIES
jgi:hypothetical protein